MSQNRCNRICFPFTSLMLNVLQWEWSYDWIECLNNEQAGSCYRDFFQPFICCEPLSRQFRLQSLLLASQYVSSYTTWRCVRRRLCVLGMWWVDGLNNTQSKSNVLQFIHCHKLIKWSASKDKLLMIPRCVVSHCCSSANLNLLNAELTASGAFDFHIGMM